MSRLTPEREKELRFNLACLIPNQGINLPSCHEKTLCDCEVLEIFAEIDALREQNANLRNECSDMGKVLESGVVIKTDEYSALMEELAVARERLGPAGYKIISDVAKLRAENETLRIDPQERLILFADYKKLNDAAIELTIERDKFLSALESIAARHLEPFCPELFDDVLAVVHEDTRIAREALNRFKPATSPERV